MFLAHTPHVYPVLEFELRKAYETIKSLRGSLTEATGKANLIEVPKLKPQQH